MRASHERYAERARLRREQRNLERRGQRKQHRARAKHAHKLHDHHSQRQVRIAVPPPAYASKRVSDRQSEVGSNRDQTHLATSTAHSTSDRVKTVGSESRISGSETNMASSSSQSTATGMSITSVSACSSRDQPQLETSRKHGTSGRVRLESSSRPDQRLSHLESSTSLHRSSRSNHDLVDRRNSSSLSTIQRRSGDVDITNPTGSYHCWRPDGASWRYDTFRSSQTADILVKNGYHVHEVVGEHDDGRFDGFAEEPHPAAAAAAGTTAQRTFATRDARGAARDLRLSQTSGDSGTATRSHFRASQAANAFSSRGHTGLQEVKKLQYPDHRLRKNHMEYGIRDEYSDYGRVKGSARRAAPSQESKHQAAGERTIEWRKQRDSREREERQRVTAGVVSQQQSQVGIQETCSTRVAESGTNSSDCYGCYYENIQQGVPLISAGVG